MLIITRREGEAIVIGDDVVLTVTLVDGTNIRLGIDAPLEVPVLREELLPATRG